MALDAGDGRVIVQRQRGDGTGQGWTDADTVPLVLGAGRLADRRCSAPPTGTVASCSTTSRSSTVGGCCCTASGGDEQTRRTADETSTSSISRRRSAREVAAGIGGWEFGTGRLHLATNGLIVGEWQQRADQGARSCWPCPARRPRRCCASPSSAPLGWEPSSDCSDCQRAYTVAPDGRSVAWLEGDELVTAEIDGLDAGPEQRHPLDPAVPTANVRDLDFNGSRFVLSYWPHRPRSAPRCCSRPTTRALRRRPSRAGGRARAVSVRRS